MKWRDPLLLIVVLLLLWQALYFFAGDIALSSPLATFRRLGQMLSDPRFVPHVLETLSAFLQAFVLAVLLGLAIGIALGAHPLTGEVAEPILVALYSIPKVTLYPIILLIFGIGMPAKVAFGTIQGVVPVALFTMNAIRNVNPVFNRTARVHNLSPIARIRDVLVPATLPEVVTGIRVGFSLALIGTLLGEMFGAQRGLGFLLMQAMSLHNMPNIMAVTLMLVIFAAIVNTALLGIDRRLRRRSGVSSA
ncbi:MAG TPA: ABC transporter permease subunit [Casimicrobiaceae bacterium]|nr:ABC transporter permease subunit [Casimicrobiaceae bacterium]